MKKRTYFMLAALAGFVGASMNPGSAVANEQLEREGDAAAGSRQCYHYSWESPSACSTCSNSCLGGGYVCCSIIVG